MAEATVMTEIRPFRGFHYVGDVSDRIAPPYDILTAADKDALLAGSADNIVSVDLPHVPPVGVGPDAAYGGAAEKLAQLISSGELVQDQTPAIYAYSQSYTWGGQTYTRRAMMCGVRATELYEGVWPHEQTFAGPKADRLKLTEATRTQLSPIFGFYKDGAGASKLLWDAAAGSEPIASGTLGVVAESIWAVTDPAAIAAIGQAMAAEPVFIADGHHRYTTALNYRNALAASGEIDADHEANFVLFTLVAMDDPGLLVLPAHRMVGGITDGFDCAALVKETSEKVQWQQAEITDALWDTPDEYLAQFGPGAMAFVDTKCDVAHIARVTDASTMAELAPDKPEPWRQLDVAVLHEVFLDRHVLPHAPADQHMGYSADGREVAAELAAGNCQIAAMLRGTPLDSVRQVALSGAVMPHKSTYFYPKLATGMVLKPLQ